MAPNNPFIVGKYVAKEYFCDREAETALLWKHVYNGRNVSLIAPRRLGKTGLIQHFFQTEQVQEQYYTIFIDLYSTNSLQELVYLLGKAVYDTLRSRGSKWLDSFFQMVSSLRVGFALDPVTGEPGLDMGLGVLQNPALTLEEIFKYLEMADRPCLVAIDEFQQVAEYQEKNVEALLRTYIQQCQNCHFIFSGSKRHLMTQMFNSPSKPFYQSTMTMSLDPIPLATYTTFAQGLFERRNRHVTPEAVAEVYQLFEGYTWFVQMMMNELFAMTEPKATVGAEMVSEALINVVASQQNQYQEIMQQVPVKQKLLLQAIAREGKVRALTSSAFVKKHQLGSASSVQSALKGLIEKDLVTQNDGEYQVYDFFFSYWLAKLY